MVIEAFNANLQAPEEASPFGNIEIVNSAVVHGGGKPFHLSDIGLSKVAPQGVETPAAVFEAEVKGLGL